MADLKITELPEETSPVGANLMPIVDLSEPLPADQNKKLTLTNLATLMGTLAGGVETFTSAHASPPASPSAGDIWLPNDSFYAYRYSGSVWVPWGPIFPMTPPVDGDFAWVNQGGATVSAVNGGIYLAGPATASHSLRVRVKSAPSTPYTITAAFVTSSPSVDYLYAGLLFRQSSDGKLVTLAYTTNNTATSGRNVLTTNWDSPTVASADVTFIGTLFYSVVWLRIQDNGTNRICSWSVDGQNWTVLHTIIRTSFLTADQVGFFVNGFNGSWGPNMTLLSWKET